MSARRGKHGLLLGAVGAGVAAITLMACYGMPPCDKTLPDGGQASCYDVEDSGTKTDAGTTDAGMDAGG